MIKYTKESMVLIAESMGMEEELYSYARKIQSILSVDGDVCTYEDAIEMAFEELIRPNIAWQIVIQILTYRHTFYLENSLLSITFTK